jgi:methylmalonyl-CoA mutase N-terminal domain/subunit
VRGRSGQPSARRLKTSGKQVRRLWKLEELEQFRVHEGLEPRELYLVKQTLRGLRTSFDLPGDMDVDVAHRIHLGGSTGRATWTKPIFGSSTM